MMDARKSPLVSVVIAAYNAESFLDQAIRSVVTQTVADWELYVIDDHSADGTYAVAKVWEQRDPRIHALTNAHNWGVSRTRNRGIELARGQYIALLDADDAWYPKKLERQLEKFGNKNVGIVYCAYDVIDTDEKKRCTYHVPEQTNYEAMLRENVMSCVTMLIPAEILKNNPFKSEFAHEDYVLGLDILMAGYSAVGCTEPLVEVHRVKGSRSFNKIGAAVNRWKVYREYLKLPLWKSVRVFTAYAFAGVKKYYGNAGECA